MFTLFRANNADLPRNKIGRDPLRPPVSQGRQQAALCVTAEASRISPCFNPIRRFRAFIPTVNQQNRSMEVWNHENM
jgi:hypothetical protein